MGGNRSARSKTTRTKHWTMSPNIWFIKRLLRKYKLSPFDRKWLQLNHLQMYLPTLSLIVDNNQGIEFPNQSWKYWPVVWIQNEVPSLCIFTLVLNFSNRFLLIIIRKGKREWSNVVIDWFSVLLFSHDRCGCTDSSCWCVFSSNNCNVICNSLVVPDTLDFVKSSSKIGNYWLIDEEALSPFFIT